MADENTIRTFHGYRPISDIEYDDALFDESRVRAQAVDEWHGMLAETAGRPAGEPHVEISLNPAYGMQRVDADDNPMFDTAGEPIVDKIRAHVMVSGPSYPPEGPWSIPATPSDDRLVRGLQRRYGLRGPEEDR